ncbi:MAG TPA: hypothetical protein VFQ35_18470 [Polyangiaceae bacterium]|nr:hypothetical protein [Polyangiaceae bacterium]
MTELDERARESLLRAYQGQGPSESDRERVFAALESAIGAGAVAAPLAVGLKGTLKSILASHPVWLTGAGVGAACAVAAGVWLARLPLQPSQAPAPRPAPSEVVAGPVASSAAPLGAAGPVASVAAPLEVAPSPSAALEPEAKAPPASSESGRSTALRHGDDLAAEAALLHRAHAAYRQGQATETLKLLQEHAGKYPRSQLGVERSTLKVLALCALHRTNDARRIAATLPSLPTALRGSCAEP